MGLPSRGSPHMPNRRRSGRNDALAGPPHLILAGSRAAQGDEELAFSEDAHMVLWHAVGPIEVDEKAVRRDEALKLHPMIFLVSSINKSLKNARATHLADGAVNEKRKSGCPKVSECVSIFAESFWRDDPMIIPKEEMGPVGVDIGCGLVHDF